MTANVAQVFLTDGEWAATLRAIRGSLRPGGWLVFETRDPARRAWGEWTPELTRTVADVTGIGEAQRNPMDPSVPEIGDELAVSRALRNLSERLLHATEKDIAGATGEQAHLHR